MFIYRYACFKLPCEHRSFSMAAGLGISALGTPMGGSASGGRPLAGGTLVPPLQMSLKLSESARRVHFVVQSLCAQSSGAHRPALGVMGFSGGHGAALSVYFAFTCSHRRPCSGARPSTYAKWHFLQQKPPNSRKVTAKEHMGWAQRRVTSGRWRGPPGCDCGAAPVLKRGGGLGALGVGRCKYSFAAACAVSIASKAVRMRTCCSGFLTRLKALSGCNFKRKLRFMLSSSAKLQPALRPSTAIQLVGARSWIRKILSILSTSPSNSERRRSSASGAGADEEAGDAV